MTDQTMSGRRPAPRIGGRAGAKWLALALVAAGCDEPDDPPPDEAVGTSSDTGFGETAPNDDDDDTAADDPPEAPVPVFMHDVLPILQASCSCHVAGAEAGVDLSDEAAYDTLVSGESSVGVPFVEPGAPEASYLVLKLRGEQASVGGGGFRMPLGDPLTDAQIDTIEAWIAGGAPER